MSDNPMNYSDLFDFSDRSIIEQALKDLANLKKAYKEFSDEVVSAQLNKIADDQKKLSDTAKELSESTKKLNAAEDEHQKKIAEQIKLIEQLKNENEKLKQSKKGVQDTDEKVKDSVNGLNALLKEQIAQYRALSKSQDTKKQKELAAEIVKTKTEIKNLNDAVRVNVQTMKFAKGSYQELEQVNRALIQRLKTMEGGMNSNSAAANKLKNRIFENTQRLKDFDKEMNQNFRNVGNYSSAFSGLSSQLNLIPVPLRNIVTGLTDLNKTGGISIGKLGLIGGAMVALTVATMGFSKAMGITADFEQSISNLAAITGASGDDLQYYKDEAMALGEATIFSANQVADAYTVIGSKKPELLQNAEALGLVTKETLTLAEAAGIQLPEAAEAVTQVLNKFNADASQTGRVVDVLASSFRLGSVDIGETAQELSKFGGIANEIGITMETSAASIQVVGKTVEESGTKLRNILLILSKGADETNPAIVGLETALDNLGKKQMSVGELGTMFGTQNAEAALQLIKNREEVFNLSAELEKGGSALEMARLRTDNWKGDMLALSSAVQGTTIRIFEMVMKALRPFVQIITAGILGLKELPKFIEENKELFIALGIAVLSFNAPMIASNAIMLKNIAIQKIQKIATMATTAAQHGLNAAIKANPIGFLISAASILIGLFVTLYKNSETVRAGIAGLGNVAKEVFNIIKETIGGFVTGFKKIIDGDFKGGMKDLGKSLITSTPIGIALSQGKRLGESFVKGYNKKLDDEKKNIAKKQSEILGAPEPGSTTDPTVDPPGPTDKQLKEARDRFDKLSQMSAQYAIAEIKLQKAKSEDTLENERKFSEQIYGISMASLDERMMLYSKDSDEYKNLLIDKINLQTSFLETQKSLDDKELKAAEKLNNEKLALDKKRFELQIEQERLAEVQKLNELKLLQSRGQIDNQEIFDKQFDITKNAINEEITMHEEKLAELTENDLAYFDHKKAIVQLEKQLIDEKTAYEIQKENEARQAKQELLDASFELTSTLGAAATDVLANFTDKRVMMLEKEKEKAIELAGDNAAARERIEERYNKKIADEKRKAAVREKLEALFQIGLNTAQGIQKAVAASPLTFGLPFSAFVAASGVAQAAVVLSKPIPQYWSGRESGPAEIAELNERGPELLEKDGKFRFANFGKRGLSFLQKNEKVHTAEKTKQIIERQFTESKDSNDFLNSMLTGTGVIIKHNENENRKLVDAVIRTKLNEEKIGTYFENAISKIPVTVQNYDRMGYSEYIKQKNSFIEDLNKRNSMGGEG